MMGDDIFILISAAKNVLKNPRLAFYIFTLLYKTYIVLN